MKKGKILHNPKAGKQEHTKKRLVSLLKSGGFDCGYSSTKKVNWHKLKPDIDFIVIAGGDGTVRKIVVDLVGRKKKDKSLPILLLPLGTANNIARSLGIEGHIDDILKNIHKRRLKKFDIGRIKGRKKDLLFLESFGFGVLPQLMKTMKEKPDVSSNPDENIKMALDELHKIVLNYPGHLYTVIIDGVPFTDHYVLIELMNTSSIGPNLVLSPAADPGDGQFELIMIPESQRSEFANYIQNKMNDVETEFLPVIIKGKKISITTPAGDLHVDDELKKLKKEKTLTIEPSEGMIEFFVQ
ncbi:MAG: NAD(+)/NADH kinase [Chitinophagaceae bacterium]|nr:NAD(+)/NADH kinase [Chitinophagaceae bacterium]